MHGLLKELVKDLRMFIVQYSAQRETWRPIAKPSEVLLRAFMQIFAASSSAYITRYRKSERPLAHTKILAEFLFA